MHRRTDPSLPAGEGSAHLSRREVVATELNPLGAKRGGDVRSCVDEDGGLRWPSQGDESLGKGGELGADAARLRAWSATAGPAAAMAAARAAKSSSARTVASVTACSRGSGLT